MLGEIFLLEKTTFAEIVKNLAPSAVAFFVGRYATLHPKKVALAQEEFSETYFPLFKLFQPYMFKKNPNIDELYVIFTLAKNIVNKSRYIIPPLFVEDLNFVMNKLYVERKLDLQKFDKLCYFIERKYTKLQSSLGHTYKMYIPDYIRFYFLPRRLIAQHWYFIYGLLKYIVYLNIFCLSFLLIYYGWYFIKMLLMFLIT